MNKNNETKVEVAINTPFIKLQQLIKLANIVSQGSDAKFYIGEGLVTVDGETVLQRGKKVVPGNVVCINIPDQNEVYMVTVVQRQ